GDEQARKALEQIVSFARKTAAGEMRGPAGEKVAYDLTEIRILPPLQKPEKSFVVGFSDQARAETTPQAEIPTGFYKLPQTFVTTGAPIIWPKFSKEIDADACLAIVIGKAGRAVRPHHAWKRPAGFPLLATNTPRTTNRREALTTKTLFEKISPSSTPMGPAILVQPTREELHCMEVELSIDGTVKQKL